MQLLEAIFADWPVDISPPDTTMAGRFVDNEFVVGGTTGKLTCAHHQRTQVSHDALVSLESLFI
jgi:hypothetical protein